MASDYILGVVGRFEKGCFTLNAEYKCLFEDHCVFLEVPNLLYNLRVINYENAENPPFAEISKRDQQSAHMKQLFLLIAFLKYPSYNILSEIRVG